MSSLSPPYPPSTPFFHHTRLFPQPPFARVKDHANGLDPSLPVIFQEPEFTPGDKTFLESRGHAVVDDPLGFDVIAADPGGCVVVGFHLYVPIYMRALGEGRVLPRVFIGTAWDVWDEYVLPSLSSSLHPPSWVPSFTFGSVSVLFSSGL